MTANEASQQAEDADGVPTLALALLLLAGCASPANMQNMTPRYDSAMSQHPYSVSVSVVGGQVTSPLGVSKVSDEAFRGALEAAVTGSHVFAHVLAGGGDYRLDVVITNLGQPSFGIDMPVTLTANWKLTRDGDSQPVWQDFISSTYVAQFGEAFVGMVRVRLANEGAAEMNIAEGIRRLWALDLREQPQS